MKNVVGQIDAALDSARSTCRVVVIVAVPGCIKHRCCRTSVEISDPSLVIDESRGFFVRRSTSPDGISSGSPIQLGEELFASSPGPSWLSMPGRGGRPEPLSRSERARRSMERRSWVGRAEEMDPLSEVEESATTSGAAGVLTGHST